MICRYRPEPYLHWPSAAFLSSAHKKHDGPATVELRRPGLAGYLDRPEVVRAAGPYRVGVAGTDRWAEPFGDMRGRVLAENLTRRIPGSAICTEAGKLADAAGMVTLLAQLMVRRNGSRRPAPPPQTVRFTVPAASGTTLDTVEAMSQTLAQLADTTAGLLRKI